MLESTHPVQLQQFAQDLMKAFLPELTDSELVIDSIHCLPKPSHLPDNTPRDVLMRVHFFFHVKECFMMSFCKNNQPTEKYSSIKLFADLSQFTMQRRTSLLPIKKSLRNHDIAYRWRYPSKLTVTRNDHTSVINTLDEGLTLFQTWDILPEKNAEGLPSTSKMGTQDTWQVVSHKKKTK